MTTPAPVVVTTSWDDGHALDRRLAGLLASYALPGTFYVAPESADLDPDARLGPAGIQELSEAFEIGGHTLTHRRLPDLAPEDVRAELLAGKDALEILTGREVTSFAYPWGAYRAADVAAVGAAGFAYARTVERFETRPPRQPLAAATTVHAYRHLRDLPKLALTRGLPTRARTTLMANWDALAIHLFDATLATGGVYHLWGHSWEVDRFGDWTRLERVFDHIARRPGVRYVVNGQLLGVGG